MATVKFLETDGAAHSATAPNGYSVMEAAIRNDIPGIVAECGGECSCATCHVQVDEAWFAATGGPSDFEDQLLELVPGRTPTSRLSCQIRLSPELEGLIVRLPSRQRG